MSYEKRLLAAIPGGAHTYSRGRDQFPSNAPQILSRGYGCYVVDPDGHEYLDYGMALRAVTLGYAEERINQAALRGMEYGNNLTRASTIELEAAELLIDTIDSVDMVKFAKNGSTAVTAAVKLARAFTGRSMVVRCADHPFFSYDDWFIASTPLSKGIPPETAELTTTFKYNDLGSLEAIFQRHPELIACVVMEPATDAGPYVGSRIYPDFGTGNSLQTANFLHDVQRLCKQHGAVYILDEMITGFRWHLKGAQSYYGVSPDLCTFGKGMANGFSVAAVAGRREIMQLGSIEQAGMERTFLLSTTHGAEMSSLAAFIETVHVLREEPVIEHLWTYGDRLIGQLNAVASDLGLSAHFRAYGHGCSPYYTLLNSSGEVSLELRTLFLQEMAKGGVLIPWIALSYRHGDRELERTVSAARSALTVVGNALSDGVAKYLSGDPIKPVFRRFN